MGAIKWVGKGLVYAGRLAQADGFEEWATSQGKAVIEKLVIDKGFRFLPTTRARKEILSDLRLAESSDALRAAVQAEVDGFPTILGRIAQNLYSLPWQTVGSRRLVCVPRFIHVNEARLVVQQNLGQSAELSRLKGGEALRDYFFDQLIRGCDKTFFSHEFSAGNPTLSYSNWLVVGKDTRFQWIEESLPGHYYLLSTYDGKVDKQSRQDTERGVIELAIKLGRMPPEEKNKLLASMLS